MKSGKDILTERVLCEVWAKTGETVYHPP